MKSYKRILTSRLEKKKKQYIEDYVKGIRKDASETTNTLGKILNDWLENGLGN